MARKTELVSKDRPWVANYPPLQEWLRKIGARCARQVAVGEGDFMFYMEEWISPAGNPFWVSVRPFRHGWEIYTACGSTSIDATLKDAEGRVTR